MRGASFITESGRQYFVWEFFEEIYDFYGLIDSWTHIGFTKHFLFRVIWKVKIVKRLIAMMENKG